MANGYDLRRTDLRSNVLENPYWITSAEIDADTVEDYAAVLFSFPITATDYSPGYGTNLICIHEVIFEICTEITGTTPTLTVGLATIAADVCGSPGTGDVTDTTVDNFIQANDVTALTAGYYAPISASTAAWHQGRSETASWLTFSTANTAVAITPIAAASAVRCVTCYIVDGTAITGGTARFHMLISEVPSGR